jgi:hypothetical protein
MELPGQNRRPRKRIASANRKKPKKPGKARPVRRRRTRKVAEKQLGKPIPVAFQPTKEVMSTRIGCYIHAQRKATGSCAICGKSICRECSNWAGEGVYLCPECWQAKTPGEWSPSAKIIIPKSPSSLGLQGRFSRALYYVTAVFVIALGMWYVYATFAAPVPSSGPPPRLPYP